MTRRAKLRKGTAGGESHRVLTSRPGWKGPRDMAATLLENTLAVLTFVVR